MIRRFITSLVFLLITIGFGWLRYIYEIPFSQNLLNTLIAFTITYIVFRGIFDTIIDKQISGYKERYSYKKAVALTHTLILSLAIATIWAESAQALFVAYGLVAAGVALALQDVFKNFAAGLILFTRNIYRVGDRIEIKDIRGDVIDIGIFNTTILEIHNWVDGDQTTGRLLNLPNGTILSHTVFNYTKDNLVIWDELKIPITHQSDWKTMQNELKKIAHHCTLKYQQQAEQEIAKLSSKYYLADRDAEPSVYIVVTDNWLELAVRYVTLARERRETKNKLTQQILEVINTNDNITIASTTLDIVGFHNNDTP